MVRKGYKQSEDAKKKMSRSRRGHIVSKETRRKIGEKNRINLTGRKQTKESIENRRIGQLKWWKENLNSIKVLQRNKKISEKKKGIKLSEQRRLQINEERKTRIIPKFDTSIEVKIQNFLKQLNISFFTHQYMKIEHGYQCDILIPSLNMVIECDGDYWHNYPIGTEVDNIRTKELLDKGFKVLRLWEHEIKTMDINKFKERL